MAGVTVTPEEMEATYGVTAIYVNRFVMLTNPSGLRIAFGEQYDEDNPPHYRTAVFLGPHDAIELLNVLEGLISGARDKMREEVKTAEQDQAAADVPGE